MSVIWSLSLSPKAPRPFPPAIKSTVRLFLLLAGAAAWWATGNHVVGIATAAAAIVGTAIATRWPFDEVGTAAVAPTTPSIDEQPTRP